MRDERRKEPRARRRVRLTLETPERRITAVADNLSMRGLGATSDSALRVGTRVRASALLPTGRVAFDAVVRHAQRTAGGTGGGWRLGLELAEATPAAYRRLVGDELTMLLARSGAGVEAGPDAAEPPRVGKRRGIPSPLSTRAPSAPAPAVAAPAPARRRSPPAIPARTAGATPLGRLRPAGAAVAAKTRRSTPRGLRPKTPSRGGAAAVTPLSRLEPGLHGIASRRLAIDAEVDALAAAGVIRDAVARAVEGLLPAGARLAVVSLDIRTEPEVVEEPSAALAAAVRLEEVDRSADTVRFDADVSCAGRTVARGQITLRVQY